MQLQSGAGEGRTSALLHSGGDPGAAQRPLPAPNSSSAQTPFPRYRANTRFDGEQCGNRTVASVDVKQRMAGAFAGCLQPGAPLSHGHRLAGGTIPFIRKYSTI